MAMGTPKLFLSLSNLIPSGLVVYAKPPKSAGRAPISESRQTPSKSRFFHFTFYSYIPPIYSEKNFKNMGRARTAVKIYL